MKTYTVTLSFALVERGLSYHRPHSDIIYTPCRLNIVSLAYHTFLSVGMNRIDNVPVDYCGMTNDHKFPFPFTAVTPSTCPPMTLWTLTFSSL